MKTLMLFGLAALLVVALSFWSTAGAATANLFGQTIGLAAAPVMAAWLLLTALAAWTHLRRAPDRGDPGGDRQEGPTGARR